MELFARLDDIWKAHLSQHLSGKVGLSQAAIQAQQDILRESGYYWGNAASSGMSLWPRIGYSCSLARHQ